MSKTSRCSGRDTFDSRPLFMRCGLGMMLSYVRTLLFFSFATNLTYVHTPLTLKFDSRFLSKGVEHGAMDALLGFSWGERCGKQCIDDGLNQGNLRRVVYRQKGLPNSSLATSSRRRLWVAAGPRHGQSGTRRRL